MKAKRFGIFSCFLLIFFLVFLSGGKPVEPGGEQVVTITMPAGVLRKMISDSLPLPIQPQSYMEGSVVVDSLDELQIREKSIFLRGVVLGRDIAMNTNIAGRNIRMALGNVKLPVTCELFLRIDKRKKILFINPVFPKAAENTGSEASDMLSPLLESLGGREYPVSLDSIQPFLFKAGENSVSVKLVPEDIQTVRGAIMIRMIPRVAKVRLRP